MDRRNFIGLTASGVLLSQIGLIGKDKQFPSDSLDNIDNINSKNKYLKSEREIINPNPLKKGSVIAITAPASPTNLWEIHNGVSFFQKMGCKIVSGKSVNERQYKYKYFSASDEERASEFMNYIKDKSVDCILCARGGYGSMRILPELDFEIIRQNPKIIIGFSDITILINSILKMSALATFHGAIGSTYFQQFSIEITKSLLFANKKFIPIKISFPTLQTIASGVAEGTLVGGNLTMIISTLGTPYEIDTKGKILLIEEVQEEPYKIDKMLSHLWLAGKLQDAAGIVFGYMDNIDAKRNFFPDYSFTIREVIESRIKPLKIPAILGLPFGHYDNKLILPIGAKAELDASNKTLTLLEPGTKIITD
ncbi:MAG: LD-carboxypeptidase [Ignavibacteriae bacterium]|nr:LD-carboxypeptidase [Ignavibacteriota bacterium]